MTRRDAIGLLAGGVAVNALGGCSEVFPSHFRFKMTVEVETPQGPRTGGGAMELTAALVSFKLPDAAAVKIDFRGEAVAVDLPGGTLFALVGNTPKTVPFTGLVIDTFDPSYPRDKALVALVGELGRKSSLGRSVDIAPQDYPKLVRFRDIRDPKTVEMVDPADFAKSFGAGVKLRRIMLTVVDGPVTVGIEKRLPWLVRYGNKMLDGSELESFDANGNPINLANSLSVLNFKSLEMM